MHQATKGTSNDCGRFLRRNTKLLVRNGRIRYNGTAMMEKAPQTGL